QAAAAVQIKDDQCRPQQARKDDVGPVQDVEPLQPLKHSPEDTQGKSGGYRTTNDQQQPARGRLKSGRNMEKPVEVDASYDRDQQARDAYTGVGEHGAVEQRGNLFNVVRSSVFRDVANDRGADAEIKNAVVAGYRKDENPDPERGIAQSVENERRE